MTVLLKVGKKKKKKQLKMPLELVNILPELGAELLQQKDDHQGLLTTCQR
jgi:hypothetical protein